MASVSGILYRRWDDIVMLILINAGGKQMAQRVYRHDLRCPHCGSNWLPKYGRSRGKQTYRCGDCKYKMTPSGNRHYYSEEFKGRALSMYSEGSSISAVARVLGVKLGTVYSWVKKSQSG